MKTTRLAIFALAVIPALAAPQQAPGADTTSRSAAAAGATWSRQGSPSAPAAPAPALVTTSSGTAIQNTGPVQQAQPAAPAAGAAAPRKDTASRAAAPQPAAAAPAQAPGSPYATPEQVRAEVERFSDMYRAVVSYHVLLHGDAVTKSQVEAVLYDVQKYVDELDGRYSTDQLFVKDKGALEQMKDKLARAHLQASLLNAKGVDIERSITEYERTVELLGIDPADWDTTIERSARLGLLTGAGEISYEMGTPRDVVEDLKSFWGSGVMTRFLVRAYPIALRATLQLDRIGGPNSGFEQASFALAKSRFNERAASGVDEFRVGLPPGTYRVSSKNTAVQPLEFQLVQGGVPDPVVLNPNSFNFEFASPNLNCRPTLTLNGLPVHGLQGLPYGTYRIEAPKSCTERLPEKITVEQKAEVSVRTEPEKLDYVRDGQPIFLFVTTPPGSTYKLRM